MTERRRKTDPPNLTKDLTKIAREREFKVGDRVSWGGAITGVIESFDTDRRFAIVKAKDAFLAWPMTDARLRYAQTPDYETPSESEITPVGTLDSGAYEALEIAEEAPGRDTIADLSEMTLPDGSKTRLGR